jgi:hypothetical protein
LISAFTKPSSLHYGKKESTEDEAYVSAKPASKSPAARILETDVHPAGAPGAQPAQGQGKKAFDCESIKDP